MTVENLLQRLDKVKKTGADKWQARCPAHEDKGPSLAVREMEDGRILLHCFAGCGAAEVLGAVGLGFDALYPPKLEGDFSPRVKKPWNSTDVLNGVAFEILIAFNYAKQLAAGKALSEVDRARLLTCASRLQRGLEAAHA